MKRSLVVFGMTLLCGLALAVPRRAWIPAEADMVLIASGLDVTPDPAVEAAWDTANKEAKLDTASTKKNWEMIDADLREFLTVLGITPDTKRSPVSSLTFSCVTKTPPEMPEFILVMESKTFQAETIAKALTDYFKKAEIQAKIVAPAPKGSWYTVQFANAPVQPDQKLPPMGFRQIENGIVLTFGEFAPVDALLKGSRPCLAKDSPLVGVLTPVRKSPTWVKFWVKDVATLIKKSSPDAEKTLQNKAPFLLKTHQTKYCAWLEGVKQNFQLTFTMDDAAAATQMRDQLTMYKMLAANFLAMSGQVKSTSELLKFFNTTLLCEAKGNSSSLSFSLTPDSAAALLQEIKTVSDSISKMAAPQAMPPNVIKEEITPSDKDDEPPMTPEKAPKMLNGNGK
ncbi:MAG: hypothetical protein RSD41_04315 [Kiritimatiellia bacterium]